mmetsp:Transcript_5913/g.14466  ORF Transcript_5913/g.14466 Transcript_5913/m.14466 type:complete len:209 (+) Transcript_5913:222-848(+)
MYLVSDARWAVPFFCAVPSFIGACPPRQVAWPQTAARRPMRLVRHPPRLHALAAPRFLVGELECSHVQLAPSHGNKVELERLVRHIAHVNHLFQLAEHVRPKQAVLLTLVCICARHEQSTGSRSKMGPTCERTVVNGAIRLVEHEVALLRRVSVPMAHFDQEATMAQRRIIHRVIGCQSCQAGLDFLHLLQLLRHDHLRQCGRRFALL